MLDAMQRQRYQDQGYLVLPGFKSAAEVAALRRRALQIVEAFDPDSHRASFATDRQAQRHGGAEFLASAEAIQCFFEAEAFDAQGRLRQPKAQSINKIGHALHDLDPEFDRFSRGPALAALARDLGLARPLLWQSMVIFKPPGIGGEVRWHQDASFFDTRPCTLTGFWFALDDATLANGCLWVEPGGHRGALRERFVRDGDTLRMLALDDTPWPDARRAVPLEVAAGTLVCLQGRLPHFSAANRSSLPRQAYTLHASDAASHYAAANWLQRSAALPVRGFD